MPKRKAVEQAERLLLLGRPATAEEVLLRDGWDRPNDPAAREAYAAKFPPNPILREKLAGVLADFRSEPLSVKRAAAARIVGDALGEPTPTTSAWLCSPVTTGVLIEGLSDADPIVTDASMMALCRIFSIHFRDQRAYSPLTGHLKSARWLARMWAVRAVAALRRGDSFRTLKPLLTDPHALVRKECFYWIERARALDVFSESAREDLERAAIAALEDVDADVKAKAAVVLAMIGAKEALEALRGVKVRARAAAGAVRWAMNEIEDRMRRG